MQRDERDVDDDENVKKVVDKVEHLKALRNGLAQVNPMDTRVFRSEAVL